MKITDIYLHDDLRENRTQTKRGGGGISFPCMAKIMS